MLLERFGLWEARGERLGSFSRGMTAAARALPRAPARARPARPRRAVHGARRRGRRAARPPARASSRGARDDPALDPRAGPRRAARDRTGSRSHDATSRTSRALARKDLRLELRARDTLPAMAALRRLDARRLPLRPAGRRGRARGARAPLGRARLHRAARARARLGARARERRARRARARAVRPQRDLARQVGSRSSSSSRRSSSSRCRRSRSSSRRSTSATVARRRCSRTSASAPSGRCSPRWPPRAARASCSCRCSSCRSRSRSSSAASARASPTIPAATSRFSGCTTRSSRYCAGRPLSTSSPNSPAPRIRVPVCSRRSPRRWSGSRSCSSSSWRRRTPTRASRRRSSTSTCRSRSPRTRASAGARCKALLLLWRGDERYDLESYVAIHQGTIFGALTLATGSIWAKASWGHWWLWSENQLVLFLVLFLFYSAYFMLRFSIEEGPRRANISAVYALFGVVADPGQLPRDPARRERHPPDRVHARRAADDRDDVLHVLRRAGSR